MKEPGTCRPAEVSNLRADIALHIHDDFNEFENAATLSGTALTRIGRFHHSLTPDIPCLHRLAIGCAAAPHGRVARRLAAA